MGNTITAKQEDSTTPVGRSKGAKGKARAAELMKAAKEVLIESGYARFTLRSVANAAGVRLNHLQYYYPTKRELVLALTEHIAGTYANAIKDVLAAVPDTPTARFMAWVDFLMEECWTPRTRRFFIQLWGLIESEDAYSGTLLHDFYETDVREILNLLKELSPHIAETDLKLRARIIAGLIEGMMLFAENDAQGNPETELKSETRRQIFKIATEQ